jgi:hypothetical protein
LQHQEDASPSAKRVSKTALAHADVWHRGRHGLDTQVPLAHLRWSTVPGVPHEYKQHLELAAGRMTTLFVGEGFRYQLTAWTNPSASTRDLLFFHCEWEGARRPELVVAPVANYESDYCGVLSAQCSSEAQEHQFALRLQRGSSHGIVLGHFSGDLRAEALSGGAVRLHLAKERGEALWVLAMGPHERSDTLHALLTEAATLPRKEIQARAETAWKERWGDRGVHLAQPDHHALYWRSAYHLLCSYAPDVRCPSPPMGFTGNAWGFHFPQDLSYIHPALLRLGHTDITRAHVEFYHSRLENQKAITTELYRRPGICWSWEFPIGPNARLFSPEDGGAPNEFQFETHNAAYPARMAIETAAALNDPAWTRDIAWPIVRESARFLASGLFAENDGRYSIQMTPSMGQDEFGGPNAKNYLCALFAAEYTLGHAVRLAKELHEENQETTTWADISKQGFSYGRLLQQGSGFYAANESIPFVPRRQKHPVQLNPLWILPLGHADEATRTAYRLRRTVCSSEREGMHHGGIPTGFYDGWTLFAFQLSAAHSGDAPGLAHELAEMLPARAVDPNFITIYESSGFWQPYYTTSMGLYIQAVHAALRHEWFGKEVKRAAVPIAWGSASTEL